LKEKDTPQKLLKQLTDTHWTDLTRLIERLEEQKSHSEKMVQGDKEVVFQYFKELIDTLEQKKKFFLTALCDVSNLISQEYTPQIERLKEIKEQQLELVTVTTSLEEEAPLKFLEKVDDVRQRVQMLKQRPLPVVQPVEIYPRVSKVLEEEWNRTEIGHIKKALIPRMRISSKRMPCSWPDKDEKEVEFFKMLNIVIVTLISVILMLILFFNQHIITFINEITSVCFSEVSLSVYQSLSNNLYELKNILCHILYLLKELMWKIVSL
jgi:tripartite motif-containing protein 59